MAANGLKGIHHVSAMTARAANNYDFYTQVMGMRLVKKTVNQDDTSMYHLFYGDEKGNPGTELTFFELPMMGRNRDGVSSISTTSLRIPTDASIGWWIDRFDRLGVEHDEPQERDGKLTLDFRDPEGQRMRLVSDERNVGVPAGVAWEGGPVPPEHGVLGLGPVRLTVADAEPTLRVLTELMGFRRKSAYPADVPGQPDIVVVEVAEGGSGAEVHVEERHDLDRERLGRGGVHHVAFRVEDEEALREWVERIGQAGFGNSGYVDRYYFRSLYFREPSGILFELATDGPGFDTDEPLDSLGEALALPPFLEPKREAIEARLKPLSTAKG
ncbi:ring-cleaving dioxygenase [Paenibacillus sp. FSL W8-1187]|uniref:Glyoxalase family protein n=1 Tax=Paenibacillus pasadenensis TaxID=217090 RepID=A0A2N5N1T0_9BACL|nr:MULTISPECIES: ring-cleaving dioxygenase [Paenibacillus]PLT44292.1 Glyoxalase family protein [Paenibacillus pasadenensis]QGG54808.1 ring-cleaving dioxygenase [Paenibacillus sp. B01]